MTSNSTDYIIEDIETFDDLDIPEELLRGIYSYGYEVPSAIQRKILLPRPNQELVKRPVF